MSSSREAQIARAINLEAIAGELEQIGDRLHRIGDSSFGYACRSIALDLRAEAERERAGEQVTP